jgi:DNA-directed RNA polymerase subunit beta
LVARFFDPKRYDLANVGRYKINKKLHIKNRLFNQRLAQPLVDEDRRNLAEAGQWLTVVLLDELIPSFREKWCYQELPCYWRCYGQRKIFRFSALTFLANRRRPVVIKLIANGNIDKSVKHITSG